MQFLVQLVVFKTVKSVIQKIQDPLRIRFYLKMRSFIHPECYLLPLDPDAEVCLHVLRLVQSVVLEPEVFSKSASELQSSLPLQRILAMAKSRNPRLQTVAQELLEDLRALKCDA